ncbi:helix-turn-helix domain-containing protein [Glaciihabitans arcticus]
MFKTSDLVAPFRAQGIDISREQIYRIVAIKPRRLNMEVLIALCVTLDCQLDELVVFDSPKSTGSASPLRARSNGPSIDPSERHEDRPFPVTVHKPR